MLSLLTNGRAIRATMIIMALDANFALLTMLLYGLLVMGNPISLLEQHPWLLLLPFALPAALATGKLYHPKRDWLSPRTWLRAAIAVTAIVLAFYVPHHFLLKESGIRGAFAVMIVGMTAEVVLVRSYTAVRAARARTYRPVLIIGADWPSREVIDTILREPRLRLKIAGIIEDQPKRRNFIYKGIPIVGGREDLVGLAAEKGVKLVITADPKEGSHELIEKLFSLKTHGVEIVDMARFCEQATGQVPIKNVQDSWFLYSEGFRLLHRPRIQAAKRAGDIAVSLLFLILSLPLLALVALVVKLDSRGPVFFRQERMGQNEQPFSLIKFRTMVSDAEAASGPVWASRNDNRITKVGRFLRKTRLDEIPQFLNVLRGEMSFIGPRPERPFFVEKLKKEIPYYAFRFSVKPGLSGWAQVKYHYGASTEDAVEKLKYDLYYIKNMSFWLDMSIVLRTLKVVLLASGT